MKKLYQENYFSRRNWILDKMPELNLTATQAMVLLMIDYKNEFRLPVSIETLSESLNMEAALTDRTVTELCQQGYLKITSTSRRINFDISGTFEQRQENTVSQDIFETFETEFSRPLSQKETVMIAEWMKKYDEPTILKALREAIKYRKASVEYIDRILVNGEGRNDRQQ